MSGQDLTLTLLYASMGQLMLDSYCLNLHLGATREMYMSLWENTVPFLLLLLLTVMCTLMGVQGQAF